MEWRRLAHKIRAQKARPQVVMRMSNVRGKMLEAVLVGRGVNKEGEKRDNCQVDHMLNEMDRSR